MAKTSNELSKEQEQLDNKRKITELVRVKFARFGNEALSIVLAYALQPVRMPLLLERLEIRMPSQDLGPRLDAICQWIFDNGPIQFKARALAERGEKLKVADERMLPDFRADAPLAAEPAQGGNPGGSMAPSVSPPPVQAASTSSVQAQPAVSPAPAAPTGPIIKVPGYAGPERRSGVERRQQPDRRAKLDAIRSNKRYGGDRRKSPKGRRKEDQPKPDFWWRYIPQPRK